MSEQAKINLLLVEDDPIDTRLLIQLLDHADVSGYSLRAVTAVADAERALANDKFDCVLLDLSLPDSDGLPTLQRVLDRDPNTPVVVLTGRDDYELGLRAIEAGAQDFLVKGEVKGNTILRCAQWSKARAANVPRAAEHAPRWDLIDRTVAAIAVIDVELKMRITNPSFRQLVGRSESDLNRSPLTEVVDMDDIVCFVLDLRATLRNEAPIRQVSVEMIRPGGRVPCLLDFARIDPERHEDPSLLLIVVPESA